MQEPLLILPFTHIYRKRALGTMVARPSKLRITPEVTSLPRRASSFTLKSFGGQGKPEASLGELGSTKFNEKTFCASFLVYFTFLIKTLNDLSSYVVTGVEQRSSASYNQNISE
ncbi:hypothetical protein HKD37_02G004952 [Glycine soja]